MVIVFTSYVAGVHEHSDSSSLKVVTQQKTNDEPQTWANITIKEMFKRNEVTIDFGGRFEVNLARTTPLLPWGLVTLPQMQR